MLWNNWLSSLCTVGFRRLQSKVVRHKPARSSKWMWQQIDVAPGAEALESRELLSAFNENGTTLNVDVSSNETVTVVSTGATYSFTSSGTWSGTDSANVTGSGTSTLTVTAAGLSAFDAINFDDAGDNAALDFGNSGSNSYSDDIVVNFDSASPNRIQFSSSAATKFSGGSSLSITTNKNIEFASGSSLAMVSGDLILSALGAASGNYAGISLDNADIKTTSGAISINGTGGNTGNSNRGIYVGNGSTISSAGSGSVGGISLTGQGGSAGTVSVGVELYSNFPTLNAPASVTSVDASISLSGTGGGTSSNSDNNGIALRDGVTVRSTGEGDVSLTGTGGLGTQYNNGVLLGNTDGLTTTTVTVTTASGDLTISGFAGEGTDSEGVYFGPQVSATSTSGDVLVYSTGNVSLASNVTVKALGGKTSLWADRQADGSVDDGTGTLSIGSGATVHGVDIDLQGATVTTNSAATIGSSSYSGSLSTFASGLGNLTKPAFDNAGNLYVPSYSTHTVKKITPAGTVSNFITAGLFNPGAIVFDADGNAYVSNQGGGLGTSVGKYNSAGNQINISYVTGLNSPLGMTFDSAGNLYIASSGDGRIVKVTPAGVASTYLSGISGPRDVAFDAAGNLYVTAQQAGTIRKYDSNGNLLDPTFASGINPSALAFDRNGNLFVSDFGNVVRKITPEKVMTTYATGFDRPEAPIFDSNGVMHVVTFNSGLVQKVNMTTPATDSLTISGGTLALGANSNAASTTLNSTGTSTVTGSLTSSVGLTIASSGDTTISGVIAGASTVTHTGSGTTTLSGTNTYSGATTILNGTLVAANNSALGTIGGGTVIGSTPPIHRYSFNETGGSGTTLVDSVGGKNATITEVGSNDATVGSGKVTLTSGARGNSDYVSLPDGLVSNLTDATIEVWATQLSVKSWGRIFDFGSSDLNNLMMAWTFQSDFNRDRAALRIDNTTPEIFVDYANAPYTLNQEFHIALVIDQFPNAPGTASTISVYRDGVFRGSFSSGRRLAELARRPVRSGDRTTPPTRRRMRPTTSSASTTALSPIVNWPRAMPPVPMRPSRAARQVRSRCKAGSRLRTNRFQSPGTASAATGHCATSAVTTRLLAPPPVTGSASQEVKFAFNRMQER